MLEYWHVGDTSTRLASVSPRRMSVSNGWGIATHCVPKRETLEAADMSCRSGNRQGRRSCPGLLLPPAPRPQGFRFDPRVSDGPWPRNRAWHPLVRRSSPRLWNETHFARLVEPLERRVNGSQIVFVSRQVDTHRRELRA